MPLLDAARLPIRFDSVETLEDFLSQPSRALVEDLARVEGDIMILGVAGKMGPTLARLAKNAAPHKRVIGVARFSDPRVREALESRGIETIATDLLDRAALAALPRAPNIIFAAGHKFGASDKPPVGQQGASERTPSAPIGEYAQSCMGRERMFEYFSDKHGTPGRIFRLNYAVEMRYGVLFDIASKVYRSDPVDVRMGYVNVIWQGDANAQVLRCLRHCTTPPLPINCTGPETISVRWLAAEFARRMGTAELIAGDEGPSALLSDTTQASRLFGYPMVPLGAMLEWVADWVKSGHPSFDKPTKFEVRDGRF
jgi:nucleoside-diphosphate-sugar epimerase